MGALARGVSEASGALGERGPFTARGEGHGEWEGDVGMGLSLIQWM